MFARYIRRQVLHHASIGALWEDHDAVPLVMHLVLRTMIRQALQTDWNLWPNRPRRNGFVLQKLDSFGNSSHELTPFPVSAKNTRGHPVAGGRSYSSGRVRQSSNWDRRP